MLDKPRKYAHELTEKDITHLRVKETLETLERWQPRVAVGFIVFWLLLAGATAMWFYVYVLPIFQGWF